MDYPQLIAEVTERTGEAGVASNAKLYTALAENDLSKRLRVAETEKTVTRTTDASGVLALPTGFRILRGAYIDGVKLVQTDLDAINGGLRNGFTIRGDEMHTSYLSTEIDLAYYEAIPPLADLGTNWLIEAEPEIYIYAVMRQVFLAKLDADKAQVAGAILDQLVADKINADRAARFSALSYKTAGPTP